MKYLMEVIEMYFKNMNKSTAQIRAQQLPSQNLVVIIIT